jgi:hypothetical protein
MEKIKLPQGKSVYDMDVESGIAVTRAALGVRMSPLEQKLVDWHSANLEYGCATALKNLSLVYWDQDDAMAWEGDHALIKPGFGNFIEQLVQGVDVRLQQCVQSIHYASEEDATSSAPNGAPVRVHVQDRRSGEASVVEGDVVVCTASLGVLKGGALQFSPPLPSWKQDAIGTLGFGLLNKLILEFETPFWSAKNDADMFGYVTPGPSSSRGKFYIFWNLHRSTGRPILASLCAGESAYAAEGESEEDLVRECMAALRAIHSEQVVPDPLRSHQTKWSQDEFARGSYSFLAPGNNGREYDVLAKPVGNTLFFAGEACIRDYPATVPGAYLSGLRSAGVLQAQLLGWNTDNPGADVLRELARHPKTQERSKPDMIASAVKQQALRELQQQGQSSENATQLQFKVAEILARQQKHRRGFRREAVPQQAHTIDEDRTQEAKEVSAQT